MGKEKIFPEYEIMLKEKKEQVENKNVTALFTVLFIIKINYAQIQTILEEHNHSIFFFLAF